MRLRILCAMLTPIFLSALCASQSIGEGSVRNAHRDLHALLKQQQMPLKNDHDHSIIEEIRDDGFGKENLNSPVLGSKPGAVCGPTSPPPCPQPHLQNTEKIPPPKAVNP